MGDVEVADHLRVLFSAEKVPAVIPEWAVRNHRSPASLGLTIPLMISGVVQEGLTLHIETMLLPPDEDVRVILRAQANRRPWHLYRLDWRPVRPHTNTMGPDGVRFLRITTDHHHVLDLNLEVGLELASPSANLPVALPIDPPLPDFSAMITFVGQTCAIAGLEAVREPPWIRQPLFI